MSGFKGNKGEWSEVYIFLKLLNDGKLCIADKNMNALKNVFLNIIKILRENYEYTTGKDIHILLNGQEVCTPVPVHLIQIYKDRIWQMIQKKAGGASIVANDDVSSFFNSMRITKLKSPAAKSNDFFGGTQDITLEVMDYRSGINSVVGFSCKSSFSAEATLFNASKDNTNFLYKVENCNESIMREFNSIFNTKNKQTSDGDTEEKLEVAIGKRMSFLKHSGCTLSFVKMCNLNAERNLILSGGKELPEIIAEMLAFYYFDCEGKSESSSLLDALDFVVRKNVASYPYEKDTLSEIYERKLGTLLYDMFTGMRFSSPWSGKSSVNGGYIIVKNTGDVVAYHSIIADEFKDFLIRQLGFESPSANRHNYMNIEKIDGEFFLKLNLQIRFKKIREKIMYNIPDNFGTLMVASP